VGIDAYKKDLFIAMMEGTQATAVTWTVPDFECPPARKSFLVKLVHRIDAIDRR
jgi:hypothetical protein